MSTEQDYWSARSNKWLDDSYSSEVSDNSIRLKIARERLSQLPRGRLLDVGCGAGKAVSAFLEDGWDARGLDFAPGMVEAARALLRKSGADESRIGQAAATDLSAVPDASLDVVTCLGVLQYVEDRPRAYAEVARVLKPGGVYILTHHNELFDLFTFNRYTLAFYERHFLTLVGEGAPELVAPLREALAGLLVNPEAPLRPAEGSARDQVYTAPENPLVLPDALKAAGFQVQGPMHYLNLHLLPPLVQEGRPAVVDLADRRQYELSTDWRAMFMGAQFMTVATKAG